KKRIGRWCGSGCLGTVAPGILAFRTERPAWLVRHGSVSSRSSGRVRASVSARLDRRVVERVGRNSDSRTLARGRGDGRGAARGQLADEPAPRRELAVGGILL